VLDPTDYGLPKHIILEEYNGGIALVVKRKSRIVMADGRRIVSMVSILRIQAGDRNIVLKTTAPVCSKTIQFLAEYGIAVIPCA
jgi:hypothetical protein